MSEVLCGLAGRAWSGEAFPALHRKADPTPPKADPLKVLFNKLSSDDPDAVPVPSESRTPGRRELAR